MRLRLIQCGVGGFGGQWIRKASPQSEDFELVALVDPNPEALAKAREIAGLPADRGFSALEAALDRVEADAVLTVTPPAVHAEHARLAFARGLHLMTEKPFASTLEDARAMAAAAKAAGKVLMVSQNYRFRPSMHTLRRLVEDRVAGDLGHGRMEFYIPADFTGTFRETMEQPLLVDMAIHHFDLIRFVTGRDIVRVQARSFRPAWSWFDHHPAAMVLLDLEGGLPFAYLGDWTGKGRPTSWNGDWRLQAADGAIHCEHESIRIARCETWNREPQEETVELEAPPRAEQAATLAAFAAAIRAGQAGPLGAEDNLRSFGAVRAAVESARRGGEAVDVEAWIREGV